MTSAAAAGASATLADVAGAGGTHLGAAGHADRRVGRDATELLEQLGRAVHVVRDLTSRGSARAGLDLGRSRRCIRLGRLVRLGLSLLRDRSRLLERLELVLEVLVGLVGLDRLVGAGLDLAGPLGSGVDAHEGAGVEVEVVERRTSGSSVRPAGSKRRFVNFSTNVSSGTPYCSPMETAIEKASITPARVEPCLPNLRKISPSCWSS